MEKKKTKTEIDVWRVIKKTFYHSISSVAFPLAFRNFVSGKSEKKSLLYIEIVGYVLLFKMWFNECRMCVLCFDLNLKLLIFLLSSWMQINILFWWKYPESKLQKSSNREYKFFWPLQTEVHCQNISLS